MLYCTSWNNYPSFNKERVKKLSKPQPSFDMKITLHTDFSMGGEGSPPMDKGPMGGIGAGFVTKSMLY